MTRRPSLDADSYAIFAGLALIVFAAACGWFQ
jgi:hypothetical protein